MLSNGSDLIMGEMSGEPACLAELRAPNVATVFQSDLREWSADILGECLDAMMKIWDHTEIA